MTPINSPHLTMTEVRYKRALQSVRNVIERLNGVLKGRFRHLLKDCVLHYSPSVASKIINSCAVLHNMCLDARDLDEIYYNDDGTFYNPIKSTEVILYYYSWSLRGSTRVQLSHK
ncbi:hypothetical protein RI129_011426 [Pyrocoelia pectoralis]|uniref:DDE Tnp4 domain-containing protein n=1 Tax=Pyrocoelia pectoralis TaxID=417401 RepID=A0AAN7V142_9COLE